MRSARLNKTAASLALLLTAATAYAQRPSDPALLVPIQAPELDYVAVAAPVTLPAGMTMGASASVAFDPMGHLWVLTRGREALFEFDDNGRFIRTLAGGLFTRAHGLRFDRDGNIWTTDVGAHVVYKMNPQGEILLRLGTKGEAGEWNEATASRRLNQPNDVGFAANGDVFVVQGHSPGPNGDARVLKFDKAGRFITSWGGKGRGPGQFAVAHGIAIDASGLLWVADRENQRIQIFDGDGHFVRERTYAGLPCSLDIGRQYIFMANGFAGQIVQMDLDGAVLAVTGRPGKGLGEFGEAHVLAVGPKGDIWVADSVNAALLKFVKRSS